jgi:hypothetical protein
MRPASNAFWPPLVLTRRFNLFVGEADQLAGVVLVAGGLIGTLAGGWIGDRHARRIPPRTSSLASPASCSARFLS